MSERPASAFTISVDAAEGDIDELGHVSNLVYVRWLQDVATAHSSAHGWDFPAYQRLGAIFVVRQHQITYLAPVKRGEKLELATWISWWRGPSCERHTQIRRIDDGREVACAVTHWVLVSMPEGRPRRIPPELVEAFDAHHIAR